MMARTKRTRKRCEIVKMRQPKQPPDTRWDVQAKHSMSVLNAHQTDLGLKISLTIQVNTTSDKMNVSSVWLFFDFKQI